MTQNVWERTWESDSKSAAILHNVIDSIILSEPEKTEEISDPFQILFVISSDAGMGGRGQALVSQDIGMEL